MQKHFAVINGKKIETKKVVDVISPITLEKYGDVSSLSLDQIDEAYKIARSKFDYWKNLTIDDRIDFINSWKNKMIEQREKIARLIVYEVGKTMKDALTEFDRTVEYIDLTISEYKKIEPLVITPEIHGVKNKIGYFSRVAKGVGLSISPFNYPVNLAMSKIIPALLTGNTIVFKPASNGCLVGAFMGEISIGILPDGVFNVVTGRGSEVGDYIITNKEVDFISFTGSTSIGKRILDISPTKDVVLELGGKDPCIIVDDSDLNFVTDQIVQGGLSYSGQRCTAIKSIIATDDIIEKLKPILISKVNELKVGSPLENNFIAPLISEKAAEYVRLLINDAINKGGKVLIGNKFEKNLVWPTIVDYVNKNMKIFDEEPFGPLIPLIRVNNIDEAIDIANNSQYGLQACVFGNDEKKLLDIANKINTGTVNINSKSQRGPDIFPFIGIRNSGFGVQGIRDALISTTRIKGIVINKKIV